MVSDDSPVLVASAPTSIEANAIASFLVEAGIKATVTGSFTSGFQAEAPGWVRVVVRKIDLPAAEELLKKYRDIEVDWDQVEVGQPES